MLFCCFWDNPFNSRPHAEVDLGCYVFCDSDVSFNSRPHAEVDYYPASAFHTFVLSTHDLTQRSTPDACISLLICVFQLTTSRRGRLYQATVTVFNFYLSTHDLTQRSTYCDAVHSCIRTFNSRPHAEVDSLNLQNMQHHLSFNSRPHAEVDGRIYVPPALFLYFQLTTSRRGRPASFIEAIKKYAFQLTTSRRGRPTCPLPCQEP